MVKFLLRFNVDPGKNICIWTVYTFEHIINSNSLAKLILEHCDICVDGRFVQELANIKLRFAGSENQRVIDIQKSIQEKETVLY